MNRLIMILVLLTVQAAASGCATANPQITRRYARHAIVQDTVPAVSITVFALPVPPPTSVQTGLTDLSPQAQAELVKVMAERTRDGGAQAVAQALALPIEGTGGAPSFRDRTRHERRLVFSLNHDPWAPADRISDARIYIRPRNDVRFVSWNRIENKYDEVEVGTLSLSQKRSATADLGLTLPVLAAAPKLSAGSESTLTEEVVLSQQRVALTGALTPESAMLLQQGMPGIDLTGNVTADFEFTVPAYASTETVFIPLLSTLDGDSAACEERPEFGRQTFRYPVRGRDGQEPADVEFDVRLQYVLRSVVGHHQTILEGDDAALFRTGTATVDSVVVIPGRQLRFHVFDLRHEGIPLYIEGATQSGTADERVPLRFGAFEDAVQMLKWMRTCTVAKVVYPILLNENGNPLPANRENGIHIARVPLNYVDEN